MTHLKTPRLAAGAIACAVAASSAAGIGRAADSSSGAVARLGTIELSADGFTGFVRSLDPAVRKQALADREILHRLIGIELARMAVLKEAKAKNWQERPDIARQIEKARDDVIISTYLASLAGLPPGFPSDAEINAAYDRNRDSFVVPRQYHLEQIFIASPAHADKKAVDLTEKRARDLALKAKSPNADFHALARANSDHSASAERGGDLGWTPQSEMLPEILGEVAGLGKGEVSDPIRSKAGWHIMRLIDTKPAAVKPLVDVKDTLIAALRQQRLKENQEAYIAQLLGKAQISFNGEQLKKLLPDGR